MTDALPSSNPFTCLRSIDLFVDLSDDELRQLLAASQELHPWEGQTLFKFGSPEDSILVILAGSVTIFQNRKILTHLSAGEYFGEVALIEEAPRSASARAGKDTVLLELPSVACRRLLETNISFRKSATRRLCTRLRQSTARVIRQSEKVNVLVHDMRSLLSMFDYGKVVQGSLSEDDPNYLLLENVTKAQQRLKTMTNRILDAAMGITRDYPKTMADLEAVVRKCLDIDLCHHPELKQVEIQLKPSKPLVPFAFHPPDMRRVLTNLILNAAEASLPGSKIEVGVRQKKNQTLLTVTDHGCGIAPEDRSRIFEKHFSTKEGGYGLGLTSCKEIVETFHGGRLHFRSVLGEGTTFCCELPR
jgi:signal transduction histidine kinase